jgi:hypothetical protein
LFLDRRAKAFKHFQAAKTRRPLGFFGLLVSGFAILEGLLRLSKAKAGNWENVLKPLGTFGPSWRRTRLERLISKLLTVAQSRRRHYMGRVPKKAATPE